MKLIAVDFDGVIVEHQFPEIGPLLPGCVETLAALRAAGWLIMIHTCRENGHVLDMAQFLRDNKVPFDMINQYPDGYSAGNGAGAIWGRKKLGADVYLDDHNLGGFPGWDKVRWQLLSQPRRKAKP